MLFLKTLLRQLILPPTGPLLLAFFGILLQRYRPALGRAIVFACVTLLLLLSLPVVSDELTSMTEHYGPLDVAQARGAGAIVILGGGGYADPAPEYGRPAAQTVMLQRVAYGAFLARGTDLPVLVTGNGREAVAMRETLLRNFDTATRWVDEQSRDTFENAANTARILLPQGVRRIVLVTSSTHMWRSVHEFEASGFDVVAAPVDILPKRTRPSVQKYVPQAYALLDSSLAIYELLGEQVRRLMMITHVRRHLSAPPAPLP